MEAFERWWEGEGEELCSINPRDAVEVAWANGVYIATPRPSKEEVDDIMKDFVEYNSSLMDRLADGHRESSLLFELFQEERRTGVPPTKEEIITAVMHCHPSG